MNARSASDRAAGDWPTSSWASGCKAATANGVIVYGNAFEHAALAYLTNFTPKLPPPLHRHQRTGGALAGRADAGPASAESGIALRLCRDLVGKPAQFPALPAPENRGGGVIAGIAG